MFNGPAYRFPGEEWHQCVISQCDAFSNLLLFTYQFDECVVDRQAIELWAVYRTECYKVLQSIHLFKDGSVTAQRGWGVEAARAAATALFAMTCMWRRIRTEEYSIKTAGDQFTQCLLVNIAFEDG